MDAKELRIAEIMDEHKCGHDAAESIFIDEICDKYATDDVDVAETMFYTESNENAQMNM